MKSDSCLNTLGAEEHLMGQIERFSSSRICRWKASERTVNSAKITVGGNKFFKALLSTFLLGFTFFVKKELEDRTFWLPNYQMLDSPLLSQLPSGKAIQVASETSLMGWPISLTASPWVLQENYAIMAVDFHYAASGRWFETVFKRFPVNSRWLFSHFLVLKRELFLVI